MCCSTLFKVLEWFWIETPMVSVQQPCRSRTATAAVAEEKRTEVSVRRAGSDNVQLSQKHSEWNIHINPPCPLDFQQNLQVQMEGKSASPEKFQVQKPNLPEGFPVFAAIDFPIDPPGGDSNLISLATAATALTPQQGGCTMVDLTWSNRPNFQMVTTMHCGCTMIPWDTGCDLVKLRHWKRKFIIPPTDTPFMV